jgi:alpha-L-fucosidase
MEQQLTELLTNYGEIGGIWFDGYWDQLDNDSDKTNHPHVDWHFAEIYALIHKLQPQCLVGNNHHLQPLPGEDFQMFEKDLPGGNTTGFGGASVSSLPLETCETINNSWGFNITDTSYKTTKQLVDYLVRAAGFGANFLLNIGPMPDGEIQPEFKERLAYMGSWLHTYGESIYNTKGGYIHPQSWGCVTQRNDTLFVHVLDRNTSSVTLENFPYSKISKAYLFTDHSPVNAQLNNNKVTLQLKERNNDEPDEIIVLTVKK